MGGGQSTEERQQEQIRQLEARVRSLEDTNSGLQGNVHSMSSTINSNNNTISELQGTIGSLNVELKRSTKERAHLQEELERPVREREKRVNFVNDLKIPVERTDRIVLVGHKGQGKTTFLYLLGEAEKPTKSFSDGTQSMPVSLQRSSYADTIGLHGWELHNLAKLLTLLLLRGKLPIETTVHCLSRLISSFPHFQQASQKTLSCLVEIVSCMQRHVWRKWVLSVR